MKMGFSPRRGAYFGHARRVARRLVADLWHILRFYSVASGGANHRTRRERTRSPPPGAVFGPGWGGLGGETAWQSNPTRRYPTRGSADCLKTLSWFFKSNEENIYNMLVNARSAVLAKSAAPFFCSSFLFFSLLFSSLLFFSSNFTKLLFNLLNVHF